MKRKVVNERQKLKGVTQIITISKCPVLTYREKPCDRDMWDEDDGTCIFHSKKVDQKNIAKFEMDFDNYIIEVEKNSEKKVYDFIRFQFPYFSFDGYTFVKPALFQSAEFHEHVTFNGTKFQDKAVFEMANFNGTADFWENRFGGEADFSHAKFRGDADFFYSEFKKAVDFSFATFDKDANFIGDILNKCFIEECDFQTLFSSKNSKVTFEKVNLHKASFLDTNLEYFTFRDVEWHKPTKIWIRRKQALWDEFEPLEKDDEYDFEKIAENYRQLVLNYERKRDYEIAENFHIGEMEMRRKKKGVIEEDSSLFKIMAWVEKNTPFFFDNSKDNNKGSKWNWLRKVKEWANGYALYKILSNYGTSYWHAFTVFVIMLVLFSGVLLYTGFDLGEKNPQDKSEIIKYKISSDYEYSPALIKEWISDYGKAVLLTSSIVAFQRERLYKPVGDISYSWLIISRILLTGQIALLLLALRRRFKR